MKNKVRNCAFCGNPIEGEDCYKHTRSYHKKCFATYSNAKRSKKSQVNEIVEYWNQPLPEKEGGLFDYDKFFEQQGLAGLYIEREANHSMPVHKIRVSPKRMIA